MADWWREVSHVEFLGNELGEWTLAVITLLVTLTVLPLITGYISSVRRRLSKPDGQQGHFALELTADLVERTSRIFLWVVAIWLGSRYLTFPPRFERILTIVIVVGFWLQMGIWAMAAVRFAIDLKRKRSAGLDALLASSMDVILFAAGLLIWAMVLLLALDNLGVQIKPLLAGLGIGGIAVALAVQTVLGDLLASMSIALDKPFGIGDALTVGDVQGTVEHIGVKSTRLRSVSGEQIIMSNADILKSRVRNHGRLRERRALFQLAVAYDTPLEALKAIPEVVKQIVESVPDTRFDRCHFLNYADKALEFEVVFWMTRPEYGVYADAQQKINLDILERFRAMKVSFAADSPTRVQLDQPAGTPGQGAVSRPE